MHLTLAPHHMESAQRASSAAEQPLMRRYQVIVRGATGVLARLDSISSSSTEAGESARERFDGPVGVTVHAA